MTRAEKKEAANSRRLEWRTRWSSMARAEFVRVKSIEYAVRMVSADMQQMADEQPQLRSEIIRAGNEFLNGLAKAIARVGSTP